MIRKKLGQKVVWASTGWKACATQIIPMNMLAQFKMP
jgi:hypothetical protein